MRETLHGTSKFHNRETKVKKRKKTESMEAIDANGSPDSCLRAYSDIRMIRTRLDISCPSQFVKTKNIYMSSKCNETKGCNVRLSTHEDKRMGQNSTEF